MSQEGVGNLRQEMRRLNAEINIINSDGKNLVPTHSSLYKKNQISLSKHTNTRDYEQKKTTIE